MNFLETMKLFIAKSNICLGSFFVHMMKQIPNLQRWILVFVFNICDNPHLVKCSIFSPAVAVLAYHLRNFWFWTMYFPLAGKTIVNEKSIVNEITCKSLITNLSRKFLSEFCLRLTLSFYRFVHFKCFSCFKICKTCDALLPLKQNLLINPPIFLTLLISTHLFQLFTISNMIMINFFSNIAFLE